MRRYRRRRSLLMAVLCLASACSGSVASEDDASQSTTTQKLIPASGVEVTSFSSLSDLVSFTDYVAVVSVLKETVGEVDWVDVAHTEGSINNSYTFRVDERLSRHPSAPELPATIEVIGAGYWMTDEGERLAFTPEHGPRFEVGKSYIVGLAHFSNSGEWFPFNSGAVFLLENGRVARPGYDPGEVPIEEVVGQTVEEVRATLKATPPDSFEAPYSDLPPVDRFRKAFADRMQASEISAKS